MLMTVAFGQNALRIGTLVQYTSAVQCTRQWYGTSDLPFSECHEGHSIDEHAPWLWLLLYNLQMLN